MFYQDHIQEMEHHEEDPLEEALNYAEYANLIAGTLGFNTEVTNAIDVGLLATGSGRLLLMPDRIGKPVNHTINLFLLYFFFTVGKVTEEEQLAYTLNLIAKIFTDITVDF